MTEIQILKIRFAGLMLAVFFIGISFGNAYSVPAGRIVEYDGGNMGKVIFDGKKHSDEGYHCLKCHNEIFITRIGSAVISYSSHTARKEYCFVCHNGTEAFDAIGSCNRCHMR